MRAEFLFQFFGRVFLRRQAVLAETSGKGVLFAAKGMAELAQERVLALIAWNRDDRASG